MLGYNEKAENKISVIVLYEMVKQTGNAKLLDYMGYNAQFISQDLEKN